MARAGLGSEGIGQSNTVLNPTAAGTRLQPWAPTVPHESYRNSPRLWGLPGLSPGGPAKFKLCVAKERFPRLVYMDLYRYFHPHHNPRLRDRTLRQQELGELEQAAIELRNAIRRAMIRMENRTVAGIRSEHFGEILTALDYVVESLETLNQAHPGDDLGAMIELLKERQDAPGWENWSRLLHQRLETTKHYEMSIPENGAAPEAPEQTPAPNPPDKSAVNE